MKQYHRIAPLLRGLHAHPTSWLQFSRSKRVQLVALSYMIGIAGLWYLFPLVHNGVSMFLPIICASWLFSYRGMLVSLVLNELAFQITYYLLLRGMLPDQSFVQGGIIGFATSFLLGLIVCWLRAAVDRTHLARQQAYLAEQERLLARQAEEAMTKAYEHQRSLNTLKDQLVLMINHELRTPLMAIQGYLELFSAYGHTLSPEDISTYAQKAYLCCQDLAELVETTLEAAHIAQHIKPPQWKEVSLREQVHQLIQTLDSEGETFTRFQVEMPAEFAVWVDQHYLRQILRNLISNALKYSPPSRPIIIGASEEAEWTTLWVQDFGKGIAEEDLPQLFDMFTRLREEVGGTIRGLGLGLYICKQLVSAMGGQIGVESSGIDGEGSRFYVKLPIRVPTLAPALFHDVDDASAPL